MINDNRKYQQIITENMNKIGQKTSKNNNKKYKQNNRQHQKLITENINNYQ